MQGGARDATRMHTIKAEKFVDHLDAGAGDRKIKQQFTIPANSISHIETIDASKRIAANVGRGLNLDRAAISDQCALIRIGPDTPQPASAFIDKPTMPADHIRFGMGDKIRGHGLERIGFEFVVGIQIAINLSRRQSEALVEAVGGP